MLKIGTIRWKGKCGKHPMYDPEGGEGAIVGGCKRCMQLLDIRESHRRTLDLIKTFGPTREGKPERALVLEDRQMSLF